MIKNTLKRKIRTRAKIKRFSTLPRLTVFRSNKHVVAQVIDQNSGAILASASDLKIEKGTKTEKAIGVGKIIAQSCQKAKIEKVVFDRGSYKFHGRIKALADSAKNEKLII